MGERKVTAGTLSMVASASGLEWQTVFHSYLVTVKLATSWVGQNESGTYQIVSPNTKYAYETELWLVTPSVGGHEKLFYGETGWSDAQRYASDYDFRAWGQLGS